MTQKVLITGANRGIGLALTEQYVAAGYHVFAVCRQASEALKALNQVTIIEGVYVAQDQAAQTIQQALGSQKIDILIQNAGIYTPDTQATVTLENVNQQFKINALAPLMLTLGLVDHLQAGSKVAFITSRMGSMADNGSGGYYGYRMSKAALNAAGVSFARDLHSQGIAVALLYSGFVQTEMVNFGGNITPEEAATGLIQRISALNLENSGGFWHSNGEELPW